VRQLQGKTDFGDAHNGLFLAAPRRTGKTTFLRGDLCPALERAGVVGPLHETARKTVALVIEEAQHALTGEAGGVAMTALKSAHDQLNRPGLYT